MFGISLDKKFEDDHVEMVEDIEIVVNKDLINQFKGFKIDFVKGWISKRFIINPAEYAGSSCGR